MQDTTVYKGLLKLEDIVNDQIDDFDVSVEWTGASPPGKNLAQIKSAILDKSVRQQLNERLKTFEEEFRKL